MVSTVPGFDEWMNDALVDEAARAGESIEVYVSRAVAGRMALERARRGDHDLDALVDRIRELDLEIPGRSADLASGSIISDPERLQALYESGMLNTDRAGSLDRVVEMVVAALAVPCAAVTLLDKDTQYVCSAIGLTGELAVTRKGPIEGSLGREILISGQPLIVEDARREPLLQDHYAVRDGLVVAYAGFPLTDAAGHTIGTLSAWDLKPRKWSSGHVQLMEDFVAMLRARVFGIQPD
ncbi:GAF domain-containing protein [Mycolicibacterium austroafricanum]|uniref:GAF domain-containing protein n=1 Tax=Mycolicibacterium austroafricanum TaxID=39687 RepID=UPI001CA31B60|nr:GAF domain-containing protein [Mycolicibacterium austroafricanum]QZT64028.1 GAF domain-containing protein [Mycolicibacterium austroafricanum]